MGLKSGNNFLLIILSAFWLLVLATVFLLFDRNGQPFEISLKNGLTATVPAGWNTHKKPLQNQIVLVKKLKKEPACYIDFFVVKPDRDYTFQQWLETSVLNEIFLKTGKQTTLNGMDAFIGNYNFVDDYFKEVVNHQRVILKKGGTLADIHMTYKDQSQCLPDFQILLNSIKI